MKWMIAILSFFALTSCTTTRAETVPLTPDADVDAILDALDVRGKNLQSFSADVTLTETSLIDGSAQTRGGEVMFQIKDNSDGRIRVNFNTLQQEEKKPTQERIIYLLDNGELIDRNYRKSTQSTHQVLRPGEKINLLKLGEGPFPLPIGQDKQDVKKLFEVEKIAPTGDDLPNTVHLKLTPRPNTQMARKFKTIDAWVDQNTHMPAQIVTLGDLTEQTTKLSNVKINPELKDKDFQLEKIEKPSEWNITVEPYSE